MNDVTLEPIETPNHEYIPVVPPPLDPELATDPSAVERHRVQLEEYRAHLVAFTEHQSEVINSWRSFTQYQSILKRELDDLSDQLEQEQAALNQDRERFEDQQDRLNQERDAVNQAREHQEEQVANLDRRHEQVQRIEALIRPLARDIRSAHAHAYQAYNFSTAVIQGLDEIED